MMDIKSLAMIAQLSLADNGLTSERIEISTYRDCFSLSVLEGLDRHFRTGEALPDYQSDSFIAFVLSKPEINQGVVSIHAFEPLNQAGEPTGELWLKMKSRLALLPDTSEAQGFNPCDQIQRALLPAERLSALSGVVANVAVGGPAWLKTDIDIKARDGSINISLPMIETPLDVPERFAGHFYIKLLLSNHPAL